jgi:diphosphomevalonate decarboxylase
MDRKTCVKQLLKDCSFEPSSHQALAFAPANIALCKYWGKRNTDLYLASAPSLSISLGRLGAITQIALSDTAFDSIRVNDTIIDAKTPFAQRLSEFLDYFRPSPRTTFAVDTHSSIPIAAGLASSACGFAALVQAIDKLFAWHLPQSSLAVLARLGSGSATRSLWQGFVEWPMGIREDGLDSFGVPLDVVWPDLRIGLLIVEAGPKAFSSSLAMQQTVLSSPFYKPWTLEQPKTLSMMKAAIQERDFESLGLLTERNALALHALMSTANPPIVYSSAQTLTVMHQIWTYRKEGLKIFFTQDAGPNLKILFLKKDLEVVKEFFKTLQVADPFETVSSTAEDRVSCF